MVMFVGRVVRDLTSVHANSKAYYIQKIYQLKIITEPRNYQKGYGEFSDAEYIMQLPPYKVTALAKNNGMQPKANVPARLLLSIEMPNGTFTPIDTVEQMIQIAPNGFLNINYTLPSKPTVLFPVCYTGSNCIRSFIYSTIKIYCNGKKCDSKI